MRIAIFGATGAVGSTLLIHMLKGNTLQPGDEIVLVARRSNESLDKLSAIRADLLDAFDAGIVKIDLCRSLNELSSVDLFIMAAGATLDKRVVKRSALAELNEPLFQDTARSLAVSCPDAFILIISNPVELAVRTFSEHFSRTRVFGMGAQQDSLRFARAIAVHLNLPRTAVHASVLGEHGEAMVPLWSSVYVVDSPNDEKQRLERLRADYAAEESRECHADVLTRVGRKVDEKSIQAAYDLLLNASPTLKILAEPLITVRALHSTPNATANATLSCIAALRNADEQTVNGQVLLEGEFYEIHGVIGTPVILRCSGWRIGSFMPLTTSELTRLKAASETINERVPRSLSK